MYEGLNNADILLMQGNILIKETAEINEQTDVNVSFK